MQQGEKLFIATYPDFDFETLCNVIYDRQGHATRWEVYFDTNLQTHVLVDVDGYQYHDTHHNNCSFDGRFHLYNQVWYFEMVSGNANGTYFSEFYEEI